AKGTVSGTLTGFGLPYRIGISRTGRVVVVNDPPNNTIWLYELGTRKELARLDVSKVTGVGVVPANGPDGGSVGPEGVTFDPIYDFAYVTLHGTNQVVAVDLGKNKVAGFGRVGAGPDGIAFSALPAPVATR
ncbi:MAG: hypothetical protein JWN53_415, partial [Gemmatimonadetes bacterium]|nr:hypothetical protein [Gemmatimonadota bacterium]